MRGRRGIGSFGGLKEHNFGPLTTDFTDLPRRAESWAKIIRTASRISRMVGKGNGGRRELTRVATDWLPFAEFAGEVLPVFVSRSFCPHDFAFARVRTGRRWQNHGGKIIGDKSLNTGNAGRVFFSRLRWH